MNGPIGSGKSFFAEELRESLADAGKVARVQHFKTPIVNEAYKRFYEENPTAREIPYEVLRTHVYQNGQTGRSFLIERGEFYHEEMPWHLPQQFEAAALSDPADFIIADDCGRLTEFTFFKDEVRYNHTDRALVYLEARANQGTYTHGQRFQNDNRFCLRNLSLWEQDPKIEFIAEVLLLRGN